MQNKKQVISYRTCLYCNKQFNKQELIRLVKVDNKLIIDEKQNMPGRGYWLKVTVEALADNKLTQILAKRTHSSVDKDFVKQLQKHKF